MMILGMVQRTRGMSAMLYQRYTHMSKLGQEAWWGIPIDLEKLLQVQWGIKH